MQVPYVRKDNEKATGQSHELIQTSGIRASLRLFDVSPLSINFEPTIGFHDIGRLYSPGRLQPSSIDCNGGRHRVILSRLYSTLPASPYMQLYGPVFIFQHSPTARDAHGIKVKPLQHSPVSVHFLEGFTDQLHMTLRSNWSTEPLRRRWPAAQYSAS